MIFNPIRLGSLLFLEGFSKKLSKYFLITFSNTVQRTCFRVLVHVTTLFSGVLRRYISEKTEISRKMISKYQWKSEESGILKVSGNREATVGE